MEPRHPLRAVLELDRTSDSVSGRLIGSDGWERRFGSLLGLLTAIQALPAGAGAESEAKGKERQ